MPAIPPHDTATVDRPWDGPAAMAAAPNDARVLRYMSTWVDPDGDPDAKGSYKFPHHAPEVGSPANLAGVRNALARLSQADIPDADRAGVERHLRDHLDDAERALEAQNVQTRYTQGHFVRDAAQSDTGPLRFVAATEGVKGDGLNLRMAGANLERFRSSPVVLWGHDWSSVPIGRADVRVEGDKLMADITFDQDDEFARKIDKKYRNGFLSSVSVGFDFPRIERDGTVPEWQLLEISAVPIPMDPDAMLQKQRAGLKDLGNRLLEAASGETVEHPDTIAKRELSALVADLIRETVAAEIAKLTPVSPPAVPLETVVEPDAPAETVESGVNPDVAAMLLAAFE